MRFVLTNPEAQNLQSKAYALTNQILTRNLEPFSRFWEKKIQVCLFCCLLVDELLFLVKRSGLGYDV